METLIEADHYRVVAYEPDLLHVQLLGGDASEAHVEEFFGWFGEILEARSPVRLITDAVGLTDLTISARWKLAQRMRSQRRYLRESVVYGLSDRMRFIVDVLVRASGRQDLTIVGTLDEAMAKLS